MSETEIFQEKQKVKTPSGESYFSYLTEPDDYEGSLDYKLGLILDTEEPAVATLKERIDATAKATFDEHVAELQAGSGKQKAMAKEITMHVPYEPEYDDDTGEETGRIILKAKSKAKGVTKSGKKWERKVPLFDSGNNATGKPKNITGKVPRIFGGSKLIGELLANPFKSTGLKKSGLSFQINAVQIIELNEGGSGSGGGSFGVEEGGYDGSNLEDTDPMSNSVSPDSGSDVGHDGDF